LASLLHLKYPTRLLLPRITPVTGIKR
jgi:hypothetical protein